jgi:hypothetical protein
MSVKEQLNRNLRTSKPGKPESRNAYRVYSAFYFLGIIGHNLSPAPVLRDLPGNADSLPFVLGLGRPELAAVLAPDQDREQLIRIRFVQIEESRVSLVD